MNEIILRIYPFIVFALPYFFYSKKFTGEISFTLSLLVPVGVYLVGNIRQEAIKLSNNNHNVASLINERFRSIILLSILLIFPLYYCFNAQLPVLLWKISDIILDLFLLPYFIDKKYLFMVKASLVKICSFIILFFVCLFFKDLFFLFYYVFFINLFIISFLFLGKKYSLNLKVFKINKKFINLIGIMALIDSVVVQIPKYFFKINNHYELIADFTIYFYIIFPIGLLMEPLSLLLLNKKGLEQKQKSKTIYFSFLAVISLFAFLLLFFINFSNFIKIDYVSAILCIVFGITNFSVLHSVNNRIVDFANIVNIRIVLPHLAYLFSILFLCSLNYTDSLHLYFLILIVGCIIKLGFIKYVN